MSAAGLVARFENRQRHKFADIASSNAAAVAIVEPSATMSVIETIELR